jgi:hypothetical protein
LHQKLSATEAAEKLMDQLNSDLTAIDGNNAGAVNTTADVWEEPLALESTVPAPAFPIHCLPDVIKEYVSAVSEDTQTSIDMPAVASLGTASACLQGKFLVKGKSGYIVPLNNYFAIVARPAERKSSICAIFEDPLKEYEKQENEAHALDIAQSANIRQVLEKELEALKNAAVKVKKGKDNNESAPTRADNYSDIEAKQAELLSHQEIKPLRLVCGSDISPEALTSLLADNNGRISMFSAEGGIFDILNGMYSQTANIDTFLKAHCVDSIRVDRKGRPADFIDSPSLTTVLFIQPDVLRGIVGNEIFRGRGLVARFLYSYPVSTVGNRGYDTQPIPPDIEKAYRQLCVDMLGIEQATPQMLTLSDEAHALSRQFYNALEPRLGKNGDLEYMADWAGKHHGYVLRIAGVLHVADGVSNNGSDFSNIPFESVLSITGATMAAAIEIGSYFLEHAQVCYGFMGADKNIENAKYILQQLEKKKPTHELRPYDIWRICKGKKFQRVDDIIPSLRLLEDYGYIKAITATGMHDKGRPVGEKYILNPNHFTQKPQPLQQPP